MQGLGPRRCLTSLFSSPEVVSVLLLILGVSSALCAVFRVPCGSRDSDSRGKPGGSKERFPGEFAAPVAALV